jgi:phosphoribosyl 1,2-cyclic phosphodiesterase
MLTITILKTGNEGNCYIIKTDNPKFPHLKTSIMVDYGGKFIYDYDYSDIGCLCITHSHKDHIGGIKQLMYHVDGEIDVVVSKDELNTPNLQHTLGLRRGKKPLIHELEFKSDCDKSDPVCVGNFVIFATRAYHDTSEPVHYWITDGEKSVFVGCDSSYINNETKLLLGESDAVLIEANYSENVIETNLIDGKPVEIIFDTGLKKRIIEDGHLSNRLVSELIPLMKQTKIICFIHINEILNSFNTIKNEIQQVKPMKICLEKNCPVVVKI